MWQDLTDKSKTVGTKVRLANVFREGRQMVEVMAEIKTLTDKDIADFKGWFEAAGFPCT